MSTNLKKKLRKLKRSPILFIKDLLFKRGVQLKYLSPIEYNAKHQFTIVSAVYNVDKYLEKYFETITNQSISFEKHIQIVLIDDGSTDGSAEIVKKWQKRFPQNITYVYKENGGQASARNVGIEHIQTDWCTFMDPDDFLDKDYFKAVDQTLVENSQIGMLSCNFIYYYEDRDVYKDNHPQNYRFKEKISIFDVSDENQHIQLSVNSAFVRTELIRRYNLKFDTRVKPSFEDATFMLEYSLVHHEEVGSRVAFIRDAKYFYRKRSDGTSALDTAWTNPSGYNEVLRYGCLHALKSFKVKLGYVPKFVQTTVMYYHIWQIHRIVNDDSALGFLSDEQKNEYLNLLREMFKYIEDDVIDSFSLGSAWFYHKAGIWNLYKRKAPDVALQVCYYEKYNKTKNEGWFYYFAPKGSKATFKIDGEIVIPTELKIVQHTFLNENFIFEYRYWVPLGISSSSISIMIDGNDAQVAANGVRYKKNVPIDKLKNYTTLNNKYKTRGNHWIIMDRDVQADDNAEHFYRYIMQNHPEVEAYFALRKTSHDWERLQLEGFNLLDFGSSNFKNLLKSCSMIISSHADDYIVDYFNDGGLSNKDFVFLPHGVFQNDLHKWMNSKSKILSLWITTTKKEHNSIAGDYNHYLYGEKVVKRIGFPRHDALSRGNMTNNKKILIMPTWRTYLVGKYDSETGVRAVNNEFIDSEYAKKWKSLISSKRFHDLVARHGYEVVFAPHKNLEEYISEMSLPNWVQIWTARMGVGIQQMFQSADIMITDYSSVAFEMGVLEKPVVYYQFDFEEFHKNQWQRGYFSYENDGFGPVARDEEKLLNHVELILDAGCIPEPKYAERMRESFQHKDGRNCERVYNAIMDLSCSKGH